MIGVDLRDGTFAPMLRRLSGIAIVLLALAAPLLACFAGLVAEPSGLLADPDRPSVDHARPNGEPSIGNDTTRLFLPHHLAIAGHLARRGRVPGWDDRGFGGRPLVGNPQAGLFYPPAWIVWWTAAPASLGWLAVAHLLWAGIGTYRLARSVGIGAPGAIVAGGCVEASPFFLAQVAEGHLPHVWAAAWYPWAFLAALGLRRGDLRSGLWLVPILGATFLAGHPQEGYYLALALAAWAGWEGLARLRRPGPMPAFRVGVASASILILTVGLVAVELVPGAMAQRWGIRPPALTLRIASRYHPQALNALQLVSPAALGGPSDYLGAENYWEAVLSIGLVPLLLAIIGACWLRNRAAVRGWVALTLGALTFSLGRRFGLFPALFYLLPGMSRFRVPSRALFLATLGAAILAGFGVEALRSRQAGRGRWDSLARSWWVAAAVLASLALIGHQLAGRGESSAAAPDPWVLGLARIAGEPAFWTALIGAGLALAWGRRRPVFRRRAALALGLLALAELAWYGHDMIVVSPAGRFLDPNPIDRAIAEARPAAPARIRAVDTLYDDLRAEQLGLTKTNVQDSFQIRQAADLYTPLYHLFEPDPFDLGRPMDAEAADRRRRLRQAILDRMAVSLLVSDRLAPDGTWDLATSGFVGPAPFALFRNATALPHAYVVPRAEFAPDNPRAVQRFLEVDPRQAVLMTSDPLGPVVGPRQPFTPAEWASVDPDRPVIRVETTAPGLLVVADTWMPGWTAEVDGRPAPVLVGNRAQRVVPLPEPGRHEVRLRYHPPGLDLGLALMAASAALWSSLRLAATMRWKRSEKIASDIRH